MPPISAKFKNVPLLSANLGFLLNLHFLLLSYVDLDASSFTRTGRTLMHEERPFLETMKKNDSHYQKHQTSEN